MQANDSLGSEFEQALRGLVRAHKLSLGLSSMVYGVTQATRMFHLYEKYSGREAFQEHVGSEIFKEFAGKNLATVPVNAKFVCH